MKGVMTTLTDKEQTLVRAIALGGVTTLGTGLTGIVCIDFDAHGASASRFIGNHALQFSKGPRGSMVVRTALFDAGFLATLAFGAFANVAQVLQPDHALRIGVNHVLGNPMVGLQLQPSLSS